MGEASIYLRKDDAIAATWDDWKKALAAGYDVHLHQQRRILLGCGSNPGVGSEPTTYAARDVHSRQNASRSVRRVSWEALITRPGGARPHRLLYAVWTSRECRSRRVLTPDWSVAEVGSAGC